MGRPGGTRGACAARTPRPVPPPLAGAGARGWGDSSYLSVCELYSTISQSETMSNVETIILPLYSVSVYKPIATRSGRESLIAC